MPFLIIVFGAVFAYICAQIAEKKGRSQATWMLLGFLFGLFAVITISLLPAV